MEIALSSSSRDASRDGTTRNGSSCVSNNGNDDGNDEEIHNNEFEIITVGRLVEVASRTWPGINKPGGVAKVIYVHFDDNDDDDGDKNNNDFTTGEERKRKNLTHVNVQYMVGSSKEKRVPIEYVQLAPLYEERNRPMLTVSSLRDRSMLLGRCLKCGSLRTDCGSCDWALEEEQVLANNETRRDPITTTQTTQKKSLKNRKNKNKRGRSEEKFLLDEKDGDGDDSDDSEDTIELQKLLLKARRLHRKNSRYRKYSVVKKRNNNLQQNVYPMLDSSSSSSFSSSSSSSEVEESKGSKRRKRSARSLRMRISKEKSVLESLPTNDKSNGILSSFELANDRLSMLPKSNVELSVSSLPTIQNSFSFTMGSSDIDASSTSSSSEALPYKSRVKHSKITRHPRHSRRNHAYDDSESNMDICRSPLDATASSKTSYDHQLSSLEARVRFQMEHRQQDNDAIDNDFIQPEGQDAIENLPDDMVDMSKAVSYPKLGALFDSIAEKLENEILPDFKLKVAELHPQLRMLTTAGSNEKKIIDSTLSAEQLLEKYNKIRVDVRVLLIQGGTDQCRAILRRLMDDRLYRTLRKKLTPEQRKRCRGGNIMDVRNLRMDAMDDVVKAFERKLENAVVLCEKECLENDDDMHGGASESSWEDSALDMLPISEMAREKKKKSMAVDPSERQLAPFDPHSHAHRVRKARPKRYKSRSETTRPTPKSSKNFNIVKEKPKMNSTTNEANESTNMYKKNRRSANRIDNNTEQKRSLGSISSIEASSNVNEAATTIEGTFENDAASTLLKSTGDGEHQRLCPSSKKSGRKRANRLKETPSYTNNESHFSIPRDSSRSISDRMQAFLDANIGNESLTYCEDREEREKVVQGRKSTDITRNRRHISAPEPKSNGSCGRRRRSRSSTRENNKDLGDQDADDHLMLRQNDLQFTLCKTGALFTQLLIRPRILEESRGSGVDGDTSEGANSLGRDFPESFSEYSNLLCGMEQKLSKNLSTNLFLHKAYNMIVSRGSRTIQDMIASNDDELSPHVRMLSLCVRSLNHTSNDDLPIIFTKRRRDNFLDYLVLQMVDALYSINLPSAWGLKIQDKELVIRELTTLRNALAESIPLIEAVSRCIVQSFGCQQWRKNEQNNNVFVSAVDPSGWRGFLQSGEKLDCPQVSRYLKLNKVWPRIETDALWRILAFTSAVKSDLTEKSLFRWQIISKLFSGGVLAVNDDDIKAKLAPSEAHLLACQQEISYFSTLISSGALFSLPTSDSILVKLIKRSLQLQSDSYEGDDRTRASCFPSVNDEIVVKKKSSMFWRISHPQFLDSENVDWYHVSVSDFPFQHFYDGSVMNYKLLLYPKSKLLVSCLSLLVKWIKDVSPKKVRQSRLIKSLKAFQDDLLKQVSNSLQEPADKTEMSFEDAFSVKPSIEVGIGPERVNIFKQETSSYLQIIGSISIHNKIDIDLPMAVWKNISDNDMKKKQIDIIGLQSKAINYTGDAYRLLMAAKVMATMLFVQMNVSPWHLSLSKRVARLFVGGVKPGSDCFSFAMSCIFACLDCLCDLEVGPQVFAQLYEIIVLAFYNLTAIIRAGEQSLASDHLKCNCISYFSPTLIRCIKMHLTSSKGWHESYHLRLCLSTVRAIYTFVVARGRVIVPVSTDETLSVADRCHITVPKNNNNDDMWGDLDDSVLAAYDLEGAISKSQSKISLQMQLFEILFDALYQSKPSKRFTIVGSNSNIGSISTLQMSPTGKFLISKEINEVCDCITTAIASTESDEIFSYELSKLVSKWIQPSFEDDEDSEFSSRAAGKLSSELCLLGSKFPACQKFVLEHADPMLYTFLKVLMDSSRLEKLPSCNFERIRENAGQTAMKQASLMLDLFNDHDFHDIDARLKKMQTRRQESVTRIWNFCYNLGNVFAKNDSSYSGSATIIGGALLNFDSDLRQTFSIPDSISLENEIFKIFLLLRNIITSAVANDGSYVTFEKISSCSLLLLANHILRIVQSLKYHDQTYSASSESSDREYKKARLSELLSSFVEIFIASTAWILREGAKNTSEPWRTFQNYLIDRLLSPILKNQRVDSTVVLQEIIMSSKFLLSGPYRQRASLPNIQCMGLVGCSKYLVGYFFNSILRRSKQLLVAIALNRKNIGLRNAIFEAVMGSSNNLEEAVSWKVGTSFSINKIRIIESRFMWPYSSPIQKEIDKYLQFVEEKFTSRSDNDWRDAMVEMKRFFLIDQLLPRLNSGAGVKMKRRALRLLSYILEYDTTCATSSRDEVRGTMDINFLCAIIKAIKSNVLQCLVKLSVDNELACTVFVCSMHLANLALFVQGEHHNLLSWSRTKIQGTKDKIMLDLSSLEVQSCYIWIFFQWLQTLGNVVVNQNNDLTSIRKQWQEPQYCRTGDMDEDTLNLEQSKTLDTWDRLLNKFEDLLFLSKTNKNKNVVNVYAKSLTTHQQQTLMNGELFQPWVPSTAVKRSLKELMAVTLSTS